jgi:hypothetical protein
LRDLGGVAKAIYRRLSWPLACFVSGGGSGLKIIGEAFKVTLVIDRLNNAEMFLFCLKQY